MTLAGKLELKDARICIIELALGHYTNGDRRL